MTGSGSHWLVYVVGFMAQALFSTRLAVQWVMSERAKQSVSPSVFWVISLVASSLLFLYGLMRGDFSIMLGQLLGYYIYIWNLNAKQLWGKLPRGMRIILLAMPVVLISKMLWDDADAVFNNLFRNDNIPLWLLLFGSVGQIVFTLRFVYQWYYSHRLGESVLPVGFWYISLFGSFMISAYGILRLDPVLILGQSLGFVVYIRNIMLYHKN